MLGIVRRASYDWLSKWRGHGTVSFDEDFHDQADAAPTPEREAIAKCEQASVRTAVEQLPPPLREAIVLREIEGLSYQQIAAVAEIPIGTVMSRLARGREQLQRRLAACGEDR
jgi:RNA polymerase sigma-70 factor (ECF subfamily)